MKQLKYNRALIIFGFISILNLVDSIPEWSTTEDNTKYLIETKYEYTWLEALHECAKRNLSLIAVDTPEKNDNLVKLLKNKFVIGLDLWIGATASTAENSNRKFVWVSNGKTLDYANWEKGEPNNLGGNQPCVHTWSKTNNFTWADGQWFLKYGYICEETALSHFRQNLEEKRQLIKELTESLLLNFNGILNDHLNLELAEKLEQLKQLIDNILV